MRRIFTALGVLAVVVGLILTSVTPLLAASLGPNNAGAGTNVHRTGLSDWSGAANIIIPGGAVATDTIGHNFVYGLDGSYLEGTNYGFLIPLTATIDGITVTINRMASAASTIQDDTVMLIKGGAMTGDNKEAVAWYPTSLGIATYGGAADKWGTTWTAAQINAADFGVSLACWNGDIYNDRMATVDYMQITVYYTVTHTLTVNNGGHGTAGGGGVFAEGSTQYATITPLVVADGPNAQWVFAGWTGDATGSTSPSNGILMNADKTATATWVHQYKINFAQSGLGADANVGTVLSANISSPSQTITLNNNFGSTGYWADNGATVTYTYTSPVSTSTTGKQYVLTTPAPSPASGFVVAGSSVTITGAYKTQYQLTMATNFGTTSPAVGVTWYDSGTTVGISATAPALVYPVGQEQYVWSSWTGTGGPVYYTGTNNSSSVIMNGAITETASWTHQYNLYMADSVGVVSPGTGWQNAGAVVAINSTPPSVIAGERYVFQGWAGFGTISYTGLTVSTSVTMNSPIDEIATWRHEFQLTMAQNFGGGTTTPAVGTTWQLAASTITISATSPGVVAGEQYLFIPGWVATGTGSYSGTTNSHLITINSPITETATWLHESQVTFSQSGLGGDANVGTVVSGNIASPAQTVTLNNNFTNTSYWADAGTAITYTYTSPVTTSVTGKRYVFTTASPNPNPASPIASIGAPTTVTGFYKTQWLITFSQSGLGSDANVGTVVSGSIASPSQTVTLTNNFTDTTYWADAGTSVTYTYTSPVTTSTTGKRYVFTTASPNPNPASPINPVSAATTVTGYYKTQWRITFSQSGLGSDSNVGTVVSGSIASPAQTVTLTNNFTDTIYWADAGTTVTYTYTSPVTTSTTGKRYVFTTASPNPDPASPINPVSAATTVTGYYKTQWLITFSQSGLGPDSNVGTVVSGSIASPSQTVTLTNNFTNTSYWADAGTSVIYTYTSPVTTSTFGRRYVFTTASPNPNPASPINPVSAATTVTGYYKTQYLLTMAAPFGTTSPAIGTWWLDAGTVQGISADSSSIPGGPYTYSQWIGTGSGNYTGPTNVTTVTMNAPITETAIWQPKVFTTSLPNAERSYAYNQTLVAYGGTTPYIWHSSGTLPPGLALGSSSGAITGTPNVAGIYAFNVWVTDTTFTGSLTSGTQSLTITVGPWISTLSLPNANISVPYPSGALAVAGGVGPFTWSIIAGSLPPGMTINPTTGAITGSPFTYGTFVFKVQVTDSYSPTPVSDSRTLSITINGAILMVNPPNGGESWAVGSTHTITWTSTGIPVGALINIQLSRDGGLSWTTIFWSVYNVYNVGGSKSWTVTGPATTNALIKVVATVNGYIYDVSDATFTIY